MKVARELILITAAAVVLFSSSSSMAASFIRPAMGSVDSTNVQFNKSQLLQPSTSPSLSPQRASTPLEKNNKVSTSPSSDPMNNTQMFTQFRSLCMSGIVPEVGLVMTSSSSGGSTPNGTFQQWLYCNQGRSGVASEGRNDHFPLDSNTDYSNHIEKIISSSATTSTASAAALHPHPESVTFVEPAPVEQMHRVILNTKGMAGGGGVFPPQKPPVVYVVAPKIKNEYTVHWDGDERHDNSSAAGRKHHRHHQDSSNKNNNQNRNPPSMEPTVYFLNGDIEENLPKIHQQQPQHQQRKQNDKIITRKSQ